MTNHQSPITNHGQNETRENMTMRHKIVLSSFIFALFSAAPAAAQDECGVQTTDPETIQCATGDYATGITYSSAGDLTLEVLDDAADLNVFDQGIAVTGNGDDNIAFDSTGLTTGSVSGTGGALIDYRSAGGSIDVRTGSLITRDNNSRVAHAIRAESTAGGDIAIETDDDIFGADTGIEALTDGDIEIETNGSLRFTDVGIRAVSGAGNVSFTANDFISDPVVLDTSGGAGSLTVEMNAHLSDLQATSGTGPLLINVNAGGRIGTSSLTTTSGGNAEINLLPGSQIQASGGAGIDMNPAAGTTTTLNNDILIRTDPVSSRTTDMVVFSGGGEGEIVVNNAGGLYGAVDFAANDGGVTFNNRAPDAAHPEAGGWSFVGLSRFGGGADTLSNQPDAIVLLIGDDGFNETSDVFPDEVVEGTIDFGAGDDRFENAGLLVVGAAALGAFSDPQAFGLEMPNLEAFDNSGRIVLGGWVQREPRLVTAGDEPICNALGADCAEDLFGDTDGEFSDVLSMPGTTFTGSGDSAILLDAALSLGAEQTGCQDRAPREGMFRLPGADCVDLTGGETAGSTQIIVRDRYPGDLGAHNPEGLVIVDVSGGDSAAGHFTLSPDSDGYNAAYGGIDKDLFFYSLAYDESKQQHKLVALPGERALRMPLLVQAAQAASRVSTDGWFDRQGDLRDSAPDSRGGAWARLGHDSAERDAGQSVSVFGNDFAFDNDYDQDTTALTLGRDFILGEGDWLLGGTLGYTRSRLAFGGSSTRSDFDGVSLGMHGSYTAGSLFVDAMIQNAWLQVNYNDPAFSDPAEQNNALRTDAETLSARAEAGWRFALSDRLRLEPLAGLSWVRAEFDGLDIDSDDVAGRPDNTVFGGDASTSLRGGVGARLRFDQSLEGLRLGYSLTGRVWEEMDGETDVLIRSAGPDATVSDEFDGSFSKVVGGLELTNAAGTVSGHLNVDAVFGDDYDSTGIEAGFRYRW